MYVKVPKTDRDETFKKYGKWINTATEINSSKNSTTLKSAKRTARYLRKHYSKVWEGFLKEEGVFPPKNISAVQ